MTMTQAQLTAEADRLDGTIAAILKEDTRAYFGRRAAEGLAPMPVGWMLSSSDRSKAVKAQVRDMRARGAAMAYEVDAPSASPFHAMISAAIREANAEGGAAAAAPVIEAPATLAPTPQPKLSHRQEMEALADGMVRAAGLLPRTAATDPIGASTGRVVDPEAGCGMSAEQRADEIVSLAGLNRGRDPISSAAAPSSAEAVMELTADQRADEIVALSGLAKNRGK